MIPLKGNIQDLIDNLIKIRDQYEYEGADFPVFLDVPSVDDFGYHERVKAIYFESDCFWIT